MRGSKPEFVCQWPTPGYGADIAVYALKSARAFPHLLISVGSGRDRRDPKLRALNEAGWDERGGNCPTARWSARCQYLSLYSPEPEFLEQAKKWNIDVVALPAVLDTELYDDLKQGDAGEPCATPSDQRPQPLEHRPRRLQVLAVVVEDLSHDGLAGRLVVGLDGLDVAGDRPVPADGAPVSNRWHTSIAGAVLDHFQAVVRVPKDASPMAH